MEAADFSGWATKSGIKCTDGRTIMPGAFEHQDQMTVPLVWQHGHNSPENVLGHAILQARKDGVYAYAFFNKRGREKAADAVEHKDITKLSIWANQLVERGGKVLRGAIREVSLVLAGANPGAVIENVTIQHSDGSSDISDDDVIIHTGLDIEYEQPPDPDSKDDEEKNLEHADPDDQTVSDVIETMTDVQKNVLHYMVGQALASAGDSGDGNDAEHGDTDKNDTDKEGTQTMSRNVFEKDDKSQQAEEPVLSHDAIHGMFATATKGSGASSLKQIVEDYCLQHGINDIDLLFPEARALTTTPEFFARRMEWVNKVLGAAKKSPFSRIKSWSADLTFDDARAKGYIKGNMKKEEFFGVARRITTPQTIYKKQKLDRDDIIDISDFDVVVWMKGEMRIMLDEELARAILIGDGRAVDDEDKINETNIRPIATDDEFYTVQVNVNLGDASSSYVEVIEALILAMQYYRGSGSPTMFTTATTIARMKLLKDTLGRRLYSSLAEIASDIGVDEIVPVEVMETEPDLVAVIVNMSDYNVGADKGGQVTLFDDFDIDFNQYKYLIETRVSGALTKPRSAMAVTKTGSTSVLLVPNAPTFNTETGVVTIVATTNVVYKNADTLATLSTGAQAALADGETLNVVAVPATGFHFATSEGDTWSFTYHADA
jgi:hypothetical protein